MGIPRYVLVAFPMFIVLGLLVKRKLLFAGWFDSEHHNINNPVRAICQLAIRRLTGGARRIHQSSVTTRYRSNRELWGDSSPGVSGF
jgi:hypothetical protein